MKTEVDLQAGTVTITGERYFTLKLSLFELQEINEAVRNAKDEARAKQAAIDGETNELGAQIDEACDIRIRALVAKYAYVGNKPPIEAREVYSYCRNWTYPMSQDELRSEVEAAFIAAKAADGTTSAKSMLERARCLATCYRVFHIDSVG